MKLNTGLYLFNLNKSIISYLHLFLFDGLWQNNQNEIINKIYLLGIYLQKISKQDMSTFAIMLSSL